MYYIESSTASTLQIQQIVARLQDSRPVPYLYRGPKQVIANHLLTSGTTIGVGLLTNQIHIGAKSIILSSGEFNAIQAHLQRL